MGVTIKDIAKIANVSHTTVSRALNDSPYINEETKVKIKTLAKELNYVPNYNAKSLVLLKSYVIGIFFSSISDGTTPTFFYEIVNGINLIINKDYNLVIRGIDDYNGSNLIDKKNFDGIIVVSQSENDDEFIENIVKKNIPIVVINRYIDKENIVNIVPNDMQGAYDATDYLIKNNHKKIALIEGNKEFGSNIHRKKGYINALSDNNITLNKSYIMGGKYSLECGYESMKKLIGLKDRPTAVFCCNDDIAIGAMKVIAENNLSVPRDISIIGFDDNEFCSYVTPTLTSVKKNALNMSKEGAKKLLEIINKKKADTDKIYIEAKLIIRKSVSNL